MATPLAVVSGFGGVLGGGWSSRHLAAAIGPEQGLRAPLRPTSTPDLDDAGGQGAMVVDLEGDPLFVVSPVSGVLAAVTPGVFFRSS